MLQLHLPNYDLLSTIQKRLESSFSVEEFRKLSTIALPLIISSLVSMSVSITDVIMIGKLGTVELASAAAASDFYSIFYYLAAGICAAIAPLIANARGKGTYRQVKTIWAQGLLVSIPAACIASIAIYNAPNFLTLIGVQQSIVLTGAPYAHTMAITVFPMLALSVMHYFLSAVNQTKVILWVTAASLPINIMGNYLFLYGNFGFPQLGVAGAGVSSAITGLFMFTCLLLYAIRHRKTRRYFHFPVLQYKSKFIRKEILKIGLPIGISHFGEMGVFLITTVTMGLFGAEILAAHTVALRMAGVVYAVPLAYAQAASVRISYLLGQKLQQKVKQATHTSLALALASGLTIMSVLLLSRQFIAPLFMDAGQISDMVMSQTSVFLLILAFMQPAVSIGTVGAGVLRGYRDVKAPMFFSLICYWGLGFIGALYLALGTDFQAMGLWLGLFTATLSFAVLILHRILLHGTTASFQYGFA